MGLEIRDGAGKAVAGDDTMSDGLKQMADAIGGTIHDDETGEQVYP